MRRGVRTNARRGALASIRFALCDQSVLSDIALNLDRDLDLAGCDHANADVGLRENLEHLRGDPRVGLHAVTDDGHFGKTGQSLNGSADGGCRIGRDLHGTWQIIFGDRK